MGMTKYLIVVDTTHSQIPSQLPRTILDVQILAAVDEAHARLTFLNSISPALRPQLQSNLYVFNLDKMVVDMDDMISKGGTPAFRFVLPGNRRPPKTETTTLPQPQKKVAVEKTTLGNQTITQPQDSRTVDTRKAEPPPAVADPDKNEVIIQANKSLRSSQFQEKEYEARSTPDALTESQNRIISSLGASRRLAGSDEATNPRVNASTGVDHSLNSPSKTLSAPANISPEQAKILASLGALGSGPEVIMEPIDEDPSQIRLTEDRSLLELPHDSPLSDEEIAKLQSEIEQ